MTERELAEDLAALLQRRLIELDEDPPGEVDGRVRVQVTVDGLMEIAGVDPDRG